MSQKKKTKNIEKYPRFTRLMVQKEKIWRNEINWLTRCNQITLKKTVSVVQKVIITFRVYCVVKIVTVIAVRVSNQKGDSFTAALD